MVFKLNVDVSYMHEMDANDSDACIMCLDGAWGHV